MIIPNEKLINDVSKHAGHLPYNIIQSVIGTYYECAKSEKEDFTKKCENAFKEIINLKNITYENVIKILKKNVDDKII